MSIEYKLLYTSDGIKNYLSEIEKCSEWQLALSLRESIGRVNYIRGRLMGEVGSDIEDVVFDANSYRKKGFTREDVLKGLGVLATVETAYYAYAEKRGRWYARSVGRSESEDDYIDMAKTVVADVVWYRWKQTDKNLHDGLHALMTRSLQFIPHLARRAYFDNISHAEMDDIADDEIAEVPDGSILEREDPIYRLRRAVNRFTLPEVFSRLSVLNNNTERLSILCVMRYIPGVENAAEGVKRFSIHKEAFSKALDRGLENILGVSPQADVLVNASDLVQKTLSRGIVRHPHGKSVVFNSPRLRILGLNNPDGLKPVDRKIYELARTFIGGNQLQYSLPQIGELVGGLTGRTVSEKISGIVQRLENLS